MSDQRKIRRDPLRRPARSGRRVGNLVTLGPPLERQSAQALDRVHAARREKHHIRTIFSRRFKTMNRPEQIRLNDVSRSVVVAGVYGWLGRTFDQKIEGPDGCKVLGRANVAMNEPDVAAAKTIDCELAASAAKVVESADLRVGQIALERQRETGADEAGASRD